MTDAGTGLMIAAALANTGLLTGIFFRLGVFSRGHDDHGRRIGNLENHVFSGGNKT
jgi:hypothetical protein